MPVRLLRILSTVLLGVAVAQAGFGSGYLGGSRGLLEFHEVNAFVVLGSVLACLVAAVWYRRSGGPGWPLAFAAALLAVGLVQVALGETAIVGLHIFLGVLYLCGVTTYCSYLWRHQPALAPVS